MSQQIVNRFLRTSELYLRTAERRRSAVNIDDIATMVFKDASQHSFSKKCTQHKQDVQQHGPK